MQATQKSLPPPVLRPDRALLR